MKLRPDIGYHPARVLIVDDERHNRQLLEVMLMPEGLFLQTAASGEDALAMVAEQPPDLILLDIMMPGMDGYEVVSRIKGNPAAKNIPVILITALDDRKARIRGLNAGAEEFLTKPVDRIELCVRVRNLLRLKAYSDYFDKYSRMLEDKVISRTADLMARTKQAAALTEQTALLDLAQDAVVVRDMQGRILFWNRGAEVMYGWFRNEALGKNASDLLRAELSKPIEEIEAELLRNSYWEGEAIHHKRDGTIVMVSSRWALQRDAADDVPDRVLTVNTDITGRKEAEAVLERSRKEQMRFKDEFLSNISHELRSPLTAIKQFTTILLGGIAGELNKEQREYQEIVLKNIKQLQSMIDDLLEVTRLESGKLHMNPECVFVSEVVADICSALQFSAHAKEISFLRDIPPDLPFAHADLTRLRQVFTILLDNAIKFTPRGGAVKIKGRLLPQDPNFLLFEVSDTGCGITPENADKVFERLYQAANPLEISRKGLGLGLYICKDLVTQQGGQIWVKRQAEKGATLSFTLPVSSLNIVAELATNPEAVSHE